ncbi:uncharacterized protein LACBIDRAFT_316803 [Laccaria bicolor S238N-H82]|uniref:Predicted protein n=1 Tax=Laccaria bicolor (strain S238N-H82 / ATCC MYA-4686) TaxID=486041 RepID=B0DR78_LACBS|nr:uncharacterized protein LACBIDRAFT_307920 [Laccaria bicolor S238N-H82]XP_001890081.1 uncharacterized protein LACBIDRAFT_316803 [Laccaria bicolor S238N-H82]EDQ99271.1 predicted protein [Laccaria bicolor S238N-H82]EDR02736.1 predicted protein [Laccaria bicolor S238N-H82]|eukprot:XP_001886446.1 predicted protein [Laccaria bicolor S238N-H82]
MVNTAPPTTTTTHQHPPERLQRPTNCTSRFNCATMAQVIAAQVIIPVWLTKKLPSFLGVLVTPRIGFKWSLMAELGIPTVTYQPTYILVVV